MAVVLRPWADDDAPALEGLLRTMDDAMVVSAAGILHQRRGRPERGRIADVTAELDGEFAGAGIAGLETMSTTPGAGWALVGVLPERRRQGVGSAIAEELRRHLREIGATRATSFFRWSEEGERWAAARSWERILTGPLIAVDPRTIEASPPPAGTSCLPMSQVDPRAVFESTREAALDEPTPVPHDDFRFDDFLNDWRNPDLDLESSTAVVEDGRVVAFAYLNAVGDRAQHGFTGTVRDRRGRGLATAAKRRTLCTAAARGVTRVTTSNAEENAAMRAINRRLGFEPIGEHVIFGCDL